ncbi:MAG: ABC transporter permease [Anaerolineales bacterium]
MLNYILRRLLILPVVMFLVTAILFMLILQLPVERRAEVYIPSVNPHLTAAQYEELVQTTIERYGLNEPFYVQYSNWILNLLQGDWGFSPTWRQPVLEGLLRRLPASIELGIFAMVPSVLLALIFGRLAADKHNQFSDYAVRATAFAGWAIPNFIFGLIFMTIFYAWLNWFPAERMSTSVSLIVNSDRFQTYTGFLTIDGIMNGNYSITWDALRHLVLPGFTLAVFQWALFVRIMRVSLLEELKQDYITTARSKGLSERLILQVHASRNALLPVISSAGVATSMLFGNIIVVEVLFSFSGIGRWAIESIQRFDAPAAVGFILLSSMISLLASLGADVLFAIADPRVTID